MQTKIKKTLPLLITLAGLALAANISLGLYHFTNEQVIPEPTPEPAVLAVTSAPSPEPTDTPTPTTAQKNIFTKKTQPTSTPTPTPTTSPQARTNPETQATSTPTPTPTQSITVAVQINSDPSFSLSINSGQNHCDVLSSALSQGKLSSLNMQYNPSFGSYAVYQINGLGTEGQVWWTYSVNGQNPPLGCSHITANNGDSIHWSYAGPR